MIKLGGPWHYSGDVWYDYALNYAYNINICASSSLYIPELPFYQNMFHEITSECLWVSSATEDDLMLEISDLGSTGIALSCVAKTKVLISCPVVTYANSRFLMTRRLKFLRQRV